MALKQPVYLGHSSVSWQFGLDPLPPTTTQAPLGVCPLLVSAGFAPVRSVAGQLGGVAPGSWLGIGWGRRLLSPSFSRLAGPSGFLALQESGSQISWPRLRLLPTHFSGLLAEQAGAPVRKIGCAS